MVPSARLAWLHPPRGDCVGLIHPVYLSGLGNGCVRVPRKTAWSGSSHHPCTPPPPNAGCRGVHLRARPRGPGQRAPGCSLSDPFSPRCSDSSQPGALLCLTWGAPAFPSWCQEVPSQHPSVLGPFSSPAPHSHTDPASIYLISFSFISLLSG